MSEKEDAHDSHAGHDHDSHAAALCMTMPPS